MVMQARDVSVVLADADGQRVVGIPVRERNRRVAQRAGAPCIAAAEAGQLAPERRVLVVPAELALQPALFASLPTAARACLVGPDGGPYALYGAAREVRPRLAALLRGDPALPVLRVPAHAALSVADRAGARRATKQLLRLAAKTTDGIVARNVNRRVSRLFSRWFLAWRMTPGQASAISLAIGLACAYCAAQTGYFTMVLAGVLFQLASAFDGVDGEMARATLRDSARGAWIDTAVDNVTYAACLAGISIGWMREGIGPLGAALCVVLLVSVPLTLLVLMRFVHCYGPDGSLVFVDRCVEHAAQESGRPSLRVARLLFYGLRRDVFAALFFVVSLSGVRAAVPMAVAFGVAIALLTWLGHRAQLLAAAQALSGARAVARPGGSA
jgi:CDP-L-myo-inositol myo-inositolphosphotransferase